MGDDEDDSVPEKLHAIDQEIKDKEEELEYLDALDQNLIVKECRCNDKFKEAREELIDVQVNSLRFIFDCFSLYDK
ncbi:hypothetical protein PHJA_002741500 [Phtheirospermum japonicum]|uniref:Uncharacterized protein n=1 Tax=Phtheirospermum japonicum TaxID=374723 RepID=A0A830DBH1_9LAMI|nr:hypothetical protein PHJA_002741500 [Phtheirospermum japonicum]